MGQSQIDWSLVGQLDALEVRRNANKKAAGLNQSFFQSGLEPVGLQAPLSPVEIKTDMLVPIWDWGSGGLNTAAAKEVM